VSAASSEVSSLGLREVLLRTTRLRPEQFEEAVQKREKAGGRLVDHLLELGFLKEQELLTALGEQLRLPVRSALGSDEIDSEVATRISIGFAKSHAVLPLCIDARGDLHVACADPLGTPCFDDLRLLFDATEVRPELVPRPVLLAAINQVFERGGGSIDEIVEDAADDFSALASEISAEPRELLDSNDDAPIIRLVDSLLQQAVKERASDVHIEPLEGEIRVRFRVDNVLYEPVGTLPKALLPSIVSRIKILGGLDIAEKRIPRMAGSGSRSPAATTTCASLPCPSPTASAWCCGCCPVAATCST